MAQISHLRLPHMAYRGNSTGSSNKGSIKFSFVLPLVPTVTRARLGAGHLRQTAANERHAAQSGTGAKPGASARSGRGARSAAGGEPDQAEGGCSRLTRTPLEWWRSSHMARGAQRTSSMTWISTAHSTRALQPARGAMRLAGGSARRASSCLAATHRHASTTVSHGLAAPKLATCSAETCVQSARLSASVPTLAPEEPWCSLTLRRAQEQFEWYMRTPCCKNKSAATLTAAC